MAGMDKLATYIRARYALIYVLSFEEQRALEEVHRLAARERKKVVVWSFARGARGEGIKAGTGQRNPLAILEAAPGLPEGTLLVLLDLHPFLVRQRNAQRPALLGCRAVSGCIRSVTNITPAPR